MCSNRGARPVQAKNDRKHTAPPIDLSRGVSLRGTVLDEADRPVAGARVLTAWRQAALIDARLPTAVTDRSGGFRLDGLVPDRDILLSAETDTACSTRREKSSRSSMRRLSP